MHSSIQSTQTFVEEHVIAVPQVTPVVEQSTTANQMLKREATKDLGFDLGETEVAIEAIDCDVVILGADDRGHDVDDGEEFCDEDSTIGRLCAGVSAYESCL
ncbi:hypothetical protein LOK49_LG04G02908 [Camellia lanceoleosa]|uniref:Uncharacterized protein n=1 Tax=Camellia lanceoleosa TaxID=1840588 RepID=A0ACC0HX05_9ERIC|nr:hypothetical protein LOK49_LG04G02908 [Camellia lanceoleosa]